MLSPDILGIKYVCQEDVSMFSNTNVSIEKDRFWFWQLVRKVRRLPNPIRFVYKKVKGCFNREVPTKSYVHSENIIKRHFNLDANDQPAPLVPSFGQKIQ